MMERTVVPIDWPVNPWPKGYGIAALICVGLALSSAIVLLDPMYRANVDPIYNVVGGVAALGVAAELIRRFLRERKQWSRQIQRLHDPANSVDPLSLSIERYLHNRRAYDIVSVFARPRIDWSTFVTHVEFDSFLPPRTVVDARLGEQLKSDRFLLEHLEEPEKIPILGIGQTYLVLALVGVVCLAGMSSLAWWPQAGSMIQSWLFYVFVIAVLALTVPFRRFLVSTGSVLGRPLAVLASPCLVDNQRGKRWVAGQATMFVCKFGENLHVVLVGPAGRIALHFDGTSSREFRSLWQRWNHPNPRPEL